MKINSIKLPFTKKSFLLLCFFACMFVFASFTREDRDKVREFKKELMSKWTSKKVDLLEPVNEDNSLQESLKKENKKASSASTLGFSSKKEATKSFHFNDVVSSNSTFYASKEKEGTIGTFSDKEEDYVSDNFFTIDIPTINKENAKVYLEYDLFGLASHESVSRSINHNISIGGQIIVPSTKWSHQREAVNANLIKNGANSILFTSPATGVKYKIKNLKVVVEKDSKPGNKLNVSSILSGDQLYVKGNTALSANLNINNENVAIKNGEFEKIIQLSAQEKMNSSFSIINDGISNTFKIPETTKSFKIINDSYFNSKGIEISKDKELNINYEGINVSIEKETAESAYIEVLKLREKDFPAVSQGLKNITLDNVAYRLSVMSGKLNKKVKISIPYDEKRLGLMSPKDIKVFFFDYNHKQWKEEDSVILDEKTKTITIEGDGDGDYINGIISTPESPQTNAFAPTSISGLKSADPAAGIQLLSPPTANQKGDAAMSYPIQIPAGRNGMQPNLAIAYNSSRGNGWMGEGWDIEGVSSISLDTRWGTPTFDPGTESEIYTLDGEMLSYQGDYLPHRHTTNANGDFLTARQARNGSGVKTFYLRRNNGFTKIERYGSSPSTYRWIITTTNGTKKYYGGDENSVDANSVVKTDQQNIVQWGLIKEIDIYNNNIKYSYENLTYVAGQVPAMGDNVNIAGGRDIHVSEIAYTGQDNANGPYTINFSRKDLSRNDYSISTKEGVKRVEAHLLRKISILYGSNQVRAYDFTYGTGEFYKSVLKTISTAGVSYNLDYYNDTVGTGNALFAADQNVTVPSTDAFSGAVAAAASPSKISADSNLDWGWGLRVGVGLGLFRPHRTGDKNFMISGFTGQSYPESKRAQELIDFNGDGVADILYRKRNGDNGLKLITGSLDSSGNLKFVDGQKDILNLKSNFSKTKGTTWSTGATILFNWWKAGFDFTKTWSESESETSIYMTDANSDGLPDIVNGDKVWFNKINDSGQPEMVTTSEKTENMVLTGDTPVPYNDPVELDGPTTDEPVKAKNDVVKVWIAPKAGYIRISDRISIPQTQGVGAKAVYSIETRNPDNLPKNGRLFLTTLSGGSPLVSVDIQRYNDYPGTPLGINKTTRIFVNSGDKVYFRLHKKQGVNYIVNTMPMVQYVDAAGVSISDTEDEKQDSFAPNSLKYDENFFLNNLTKAITYDYWGSGNVTVPGFKIPRLSDEVTFKITLSKTDVVDPSTDVKVIYSKTYPQSAGQVDVDAVNEPFSIPLASSNWHLKFLVESDSYTSKDLEWNGIVATKGSIAANDLASYPSFVIRDFKKKFHVSALVNAPQGMNDFGISINKNISFTPVKAGTFMYVIRKNGFTLEKRTVTITNSGVTETYMYGGAVNGIVPIKFFYGDPYTPAKPEDKINIMVFCNTLRDRLAYESLKVQLQNKVFNIYYGNPSQVAGTTVETSINTGEFNGISAVYGNWGQFIYNESKDVKKGNNNNVLTPPSDPKNTPNAPVQTSGPDYIINSDTPKDQYGMLINNDFLDAPFGQLNNYDFSSCAGSTNQTQYGDCVGDILQANFQNMANTNILGAFTPIVPLTTYTKKPEIKKWSHNIFSEQYSMASSFRDEENVEPFFVSDDPDQQDTELPGLLNTKMYAISKKQKSKSATTNFGIGIPAISTSNSQLRGYGNINTQDFFDVNGDGYPDMLYRKQLQLSNSLGGLKGGSGRNIENNADSVISSSDSFQKSKTIAFSPTAVKDVGRNTSNSSTDAKPDTSASWSGGLSNSDYDSNSYDKGLEYWIDVNGDGLVDRVKEVDGKFKYKLNYGTGLVDNPFEDFNGLETYSSTPVGATSISIGAGISGMIDQTSAVTSGWGISGSVSASASSGSSKNTFQDVNGDGLVDIVTVNSDGTAGIKYNIGNKFVSGGNLSKLGGAVNLAREVKTYNGALGLNAGLYVNVPLITIFGATILYFRMGADASGNLGISVSEVNSGLRDVNGDGYPDIVVDTGSGLKVNYSKIGRTNKLSKVTEVNTNGTFIIDYGFTQPTYKDPHAKLVMNKVTVLNPDASTDSYTTTNATKNIVTQFRYENSKYDRRERMSYGFNKVVTERLNGTTVYSKTAQYYYNTSYFNYGLLQKSEVYSTAALSSRTTYTYRLFNYTNNFTQIAPVPAAQFDAYDAGGTEGRRTAMTLLLATNNAVYEAGGSIATSSVMTYNSKGQVTSYKYNSNVPNGNYLSTILYHNIAGLIAKNILDLPSEIKVVNDSGVLLRQRNTLVDPTNGNITSVIVKVNDSQVAETKMEYYPNGNLKTITDPDQYKLTYDYDPMGKYVTKVADSHGVFSSATYDAKWDKVLESTDIAGNKMKYTYDSMGRLTSLLGPKEVGVSPYTVEYSYFLSPLTIGAKQLNLYGSLTKNYDPQHPTNPIETIGLSDFTGRSVQVKKDIEIGGQEKVSVSGFAVYDVYGRSTKQYHPTFENKDLVLNKKLKTSLAQYFVQTQYDSLDRVVGEIDEDGNSTGSKYDIESGNTKVTVNQMQNTSAELKSETLTNAEGKTVATRNYIGNQVPTSTYYYNAVGELVSAIDPAGIKTNYGYDKGGRRIIVEHVDHGASRFEYSIGGRMTSRTTANLQNSGLADPFIRYEYKFDRLVNINYPNLPNGLPNPSNVAFEYGDIGNEIAKVAAKTDGTGLILYNYGSMGELIKENRTITGYNVSLNNVKTEYIYDSWNRIQSIKYPDGELVSYQYDLGGNLKSITSATFGQYVKEITYDEYEQKTNIKYGNDVYSTYTYIPSRRMLNSYTLKKDNYTTFIGNNFWYDNVGNILRIASNSPKTPNNIGGGFEFTYGYDQLNRLVSSKASFSSTIKDPDTVGSSMASYTGTFEYNKANGIYRKQQDHKIDNQVIGANTYNNEYQYIDGTHKLTRVKDPISGKEQTFKYDANGNLILHELMDNGEKNLFWDEEDNLKAYYSPEEGTYQYYAYDNTGERTIKYSLNEGTRLWQNGALLDGTMVMNSYKVYPNAYLAVTSDGKYTKHYYAGSERIASRLLDNNGVFSKSSAAASKEKEKNTVDADQDFKNYLLKTGIEPGSIENAFMVSGAQNGLYYLHGDHLGTATYVTDGTGTETQFFLNLPFGETFFEQQVQNKYVNPYKFNAKELDSETGLYYYGARYYNPRLSIWYGVDPLAVYNPVMEDQFYGDGQHNDGVYFWGNLNPYIYTYQNPINLIDPNGKQTTSDAQRGTGYRGGIPIPIYKKGDGYYPFPVHSQEEYREGFDKLKNNVQALAVMGFTAIVVAPMKEGFDVVTGLANRVLNSDTEFIPTNNGNINSEIKKVVAGEGTTRKNPDGSDKIFQGTEYKEGKRGYESQKNWIGAVEYEAPGKSLEHNRILKKTNSDGSIKYGYSTDDDYKKIHELKKK